MITRRVIMLIKSRYFGHMNPTDKDEILRIADDVKFDFAARQIAAIEGISLTEAGHRLGMAAYGQQVEVAKAELIQMRDELGS